MAPANCSLQSAWVEGSVAMLLILEFGLGLLSNAVALWAFCLRLQVWKPYAVYLFNLALADLLLSACLPFRIAFYLRHKKWSWGHASCHALLFLLSVTRGAGVAFLTAVALDRYLRVVHPRFKVNALSVRGARVVSACVWLLVAGLAPQGLLLPGAPSNSTECRGQPREDLSVGAVWPEALLLLQFVLPFGLILLCNAGLIHTLQARLREPGGQPRLRRARALVTTVVVLFALCFLPSFLVRVLADVYRGSQSCAVLRAVEHASDVAGGLTYLNSVLNPVVYCFSNPTFRVSYRRAFNTLRGRRRGPEPQDLDLRDSDS
ncbi:PREDICTED: 12-(S)-hydroxy-5,8,10,14-eicosatetraenoic acid receptor [Elephantulus edwardii]|uniref:12-(S)-hydroxy-5,8,10,14-eicosatetraenoic acid receptor n=1 Tax=Elephantulus edwardii TaxID=28737 RepID=UPI0003F087AE|nr:PREDICTED: 12-(S)-hydroxy-5,8,10,14-eicosatetraenoic acid receptor [Elephantulus edwardii]